MARKKKTEPKPRDPLAAPIEEALLLSGMSATNFGYRYFGDPAFIGKMRKGRRFYDRTRAKIETILAELGVEA